MVASWLSRFKVLDTPERVMPLADLDVVILTRDVVAQLKREVELVRDSAPTVARCIDASIREADWWHMRGGM